MSPDRKFFEHLKASDPLAYGHLQTVLRICAPVIIVCVLFVIVGTALEFQSKNRFDANSYPLTDFLGHEIVGVFILLVSARCWVLSLKKD